MKLVGEVGNCKIVAHIAFKFYSVASGTFSTGSTGSIHIGNYLGAIRHSVARQAEFENIFCIVDLHAISIPQEPETLKAKTREIAALLLASGVDLKQSAVFV